MRPPVNRRTLRTLRLNSWYKGNAHIMGPWFPGSFKLRFGVVENAGEFLLGHDPGYFTCSSLEGNLGLFPSFGNGELGTKEDEVYLRVCFGVLGKFALRRAMAGVFWI